MGLFQGLLICIINQFFEKYIMCNKEMALKKLFPDTILVILDSSTLVLDEMKCDLGFQT